MRYLFIFVIGEISFKFGYEKAVTFKLVINAVKLIVRMAGVMTSVFFIFPKGRSSKLDHL